MKICWVLGYMENVICAHKELVVQNPVQSVTFIEVRILSIVVCEYFKTEMVTESRMCIYEC